MLFSLNFHSAQIAGYSPQLLWKTSKLLFNKVQFPGSCLRYVWGVSCGLYVYWWILAHLTHIPASVSPLHLADIQSPLCWLRMRHLIFKFWSQIQDHHWHLPLSSPSLMLSSTTFDIHLDSMVASDNMLIHGQDCLGLNPNPGHLCTIGCSKGLKSKLQVQLMQQQKVVFASTLYPWLLVI